MFAFVSATMYKEEFTEKPNLWYMSATSVNVCDAK